MSSHAQPLYLSILLTTTVELQNKTADVYQLFV